MIVEDRVEPPFAIRRLSPDETVTMWRARLKTARMAKPRTYNVTNDDLRYQFLQRVLSKELSVKQASFLFAIYP